MQSKERKRKKESKVKINQSRGFSAMFDFCCEVLKEIYNNQFIKIDEMTESSLEFNPTLWKGFTSYCISYCPFCGAEIKITIEGRKNAK